MLRFRGQCNGQSADSTPTPPAVRAITGGVGGFMRLGRAAGGRYWLQCAQGT